MAGMSTHTHSFENGINSLSSLLFPFGMGIGCCRFWDASRFAYLVTCRALFPSSLTSPAVLSNPENDMSTIICSYIPTGVAFKILMH
jgi:hypothetical protein